MGANPDQRSHQQTTQDEDFQVAVKQAVTNAQLEMWGMAKQFGDQLKLQFFNQVGEIICAEGNAFAQVKNIRELWGDVVAAIAMYEAGMGIYVQWIQAQFDACTGVNECGHE